MKMMIREATADDVPLLTRLIRESFHDVAERIGLTLENCPSHASNCTEEWVASQLGQGIRFYLAEIDAVPCGCVAVEQTGADICKMKRLGVLPAFRKKGLGETLVRHALTIAGTLGAKRVEIGIIAEEAELKGWYSRLGFAVQREALSVAHLPFAVTYLSVEL